MRGFFERKHDIQNKKKATLRSWKRYYGILCGQLLCFFKDEAHFAQNTTTIPPVNIYQAICEPFPECKRKNAFR